ncbi:malonyl-ACP O-methyltransferase BioC [Paenibacillus sp. KN14-4R]|uniref:malonyl-ACP O-methyltransferase BioC n=1 Tax=Paenibacillus sp. KN14-4R TaxID=3445773 RepID=UPI003FA02B1B
MDILKQQVLRQFNRAVRTYDQHAVIQTKMAHQLLEGLVLPREDTRILEIGCGTGILTQLLLERFPKARLTVIDMAEDMVAAARLRVNGSEAVTFIVGDVEHMDESDHAPFDLIISNAVIQWLRDPYATISKLSRMLIRNGYILASTFGPGTFHELHEVFAEVKDEMNLPNASHGLPMQDAMAWQDYFHQSGYQDIHVIQRYEQLVYPNCRTFMKSIKAVGASYSEGSYAIGTTKLLLQEVMKRYDRRFVMDDGVYTTYETIEIRAKIGDEKGFIEG